MNLIVEFMYQSRPTYFTQESKVIGLMFSLAIYIDGYKSRC